VRIFGLNPRVAPHERNGGEAGKSAYKEAMDSFDAILLGGGLVGQSLALALDTHGIRCAIIDPIDPATTLSPDFDGRATAIASASWRMFEAIGLADTLHPDGCPIRKIEVRDGLSPESLDFSTEPDEDALGVMVENRLIRKALVEATSASKSITKFYGDQVAEMDRTEHRAELKLASGKKISAPLVLVCEGRNSVTRDGAGISLTHWRYDHRAIISAFDHSVPHDNVAHEIFFPAGPFALLPMQPGTRSALVWTVDEKDAEGVLALGNRAFAHEVQKRTGGVLGDITMAAHRSSYKLGFHHAARLTDTRLALVGDAGHGIHPIAGQGLNLGLRDVATLVEVLVDAARLGLDLGDAQVLERYERWRGLDTFMVALATDSLTRIYGVPGKTARAVRRFGMGAIQRIKPAKLLLMSEARGESGDLPKLLQGELV
jgi:2-octaprenyl-6-methoxyphenol hydroxylase